MGDIDFRKAVAATDGASAKEILLEFAQSLARVASAAEFVADSEYHTYERFVARKHPDILYKEYENREAVLTAHREALQDSSEKLAKMADVLLGFLGE